MKKDRNRLEISYGHARAAADGKFAILVHVLAIATLVLTVLFVLYVGSRVLGLLTVTALYAIFSRPAAGAPLAPPT